MVEETKTVAHAVKTKVEEAREAGLPVAYAGKQALWQFIARDVFGNIRLDNDTIIVDIDEVVNASVFKERDYPNPTLSGTWNNTCECYDVKFDTDKSMRWDDQNFMYSVTVKLGQNCKPQPHNLA